MSAAGSAGQTRGVAATGGVTRTGPGVYEVVFSGDRSACSVATTITGTTFGEITATPAVAGDNTTVTVRTATSDGATPADRAFHLTLNC